MYDNDDDNILMEKQSTLFTLLSLLESVLWAAVTCLDIYSWCGLTVISFSSLIVRIRVLLTLNDDDFACDVCISGSEAYSHKGDTINKNTFPVTKRN